MALTTLYKRSSDGPTRYSFTKSISLAVTVQWCVGHIVTMPGQVVSAPRNGVPDLGKVWQGTGRFLCQCQIHLLLDVVLLGGVGESSG